MFTIHIEASTYKELLQKVDDLHDDMIGYTPSLITGHDEEVTDEEVDDIVAYSNEEVLARIETAHPHTNLPKVYPPDMTEPGELDSAGMPWDERIHSAYKSKKEDGTWRVRRNIDKTVLAKVQAEKPVVVAPKDQVVVTPTAPAVAIPVEPVTPPLAFTPPAAPVQVVTGGHTLETFKANLITVIADLTNTGKINKEYVAALNAYFEVKEIWEIFKDETKVAALFENFVAAGLIVKVG